jgi:hypothetical protein
MHNEKVKIFLDFLDKNDIDSALFMFYANPKNNGFKFKKYKSISEFFKKEPCELWVKNAFRWDSNEDFEIRKLLEIDKKWREVCKKTDKNLKLKAIPKWFKKIIKKGE